MLCSISTTWKLILQRILCITGVLLYVDTFWSLVNLFQVSTDQLFVAYN